MERIVVVALLVLGGMATSNDNPTTLGELFDKLYGLPMHAWYHHVLLKNSDDNSNFVVPLEKDVNEILRFLNFLKVRTVSQLSRDLEAVTLQSIYDNLNDRCFKYLNTTIQDLTVTPSDMTCVRIQLVKQLIIMLQEAIDITHQEWSARCAQTELGICSTVKPNCSVPYGEEVTQLLRSFVEDYDNAEPASGETPLAIINQYVVNSIEYMKLPFTSTFAFLTSIAYLVLKSPPIEPFGFANLVYPMSNKFSSTVLVKTENNTMSQDDFTWGIVRSNTGTVNLTCSNFRDVYSRNSSQFLEYLISCYSVSMVKFNTVLMDCVYADPNLGPLTWLTVHSVYFHSQCLCVAFNGNECGVKAPQGVDAHSYCLSVLLRDFQRQVSYRPAVTYLDYAFQTRVPVCKFTELLSVSFSGICNAHINKIPSQAISSKQCYFKDIVNKYLNCPKTLQVNTYNISELCAAKSFMRYVICQNDTNYEFRVRYYRAGDSTLVLVLTFLDVAVRLLALVTYLACPQLRNLPGKLLIGYQVTALLRLVAVRASLEDLPMAVRLDVAMDLASTLWLSAFLHFLTTSIKALRLPDSLSKAEARQVLLRYSLFGWALPTVLSTAFFWMDDFLDSHVQFGQLLFVLCTFAALLSNLYMFFYNCHFYYDVISNARIIKQGVTARSVFADLFRFALKTSLLSGAGIIFRLVFTQIQGLQHLLSYYHALSTLQGLLFFLLYGCNIEARVFWLGVFRATLRRCPRRHNTSLNDSPSEMAEIPVTRPPSEHVS